MIPVLKTQRGTALLLALLVLFLGSGLVILAFSLSRNEQTMANLSVEGHRADALAESGLAMALFWAANPGVAPQENNANVFFINLATTPCPPAPLPPPPQPLVAQFPLPPAIATIAPLPLPSLPIPVPISDAFASLGPIGGRITLSFDPPNPANPASICRVTSTAMTHGGASRTVQVDLTRSPLVPSLPPLPPSQVFPLKGTWR